MNRQPSQREGEQFLLMPLIEELFPICRSITGNGVRQTLKGIAQRLPLEVFEVPSGTPAFDWLVPDEWNIRDAYIATMAGERVVDFRDSNLHVLNYSEPVDEIVDLGTLQEHLYSLPDHPAWIPYRTSYYTRNWGFCVSEQQRSSLTQTQYRVRIDSDLAPGSLTYGECRIPGSSSREILLYTHVCHPSLCNDNLSGIAVMSAVGRRLLEMRRPRYSYRLVFAPGTIGSIVWLSQNRERLHNVAHGLVLGLLGDDNSHTYKRTRSGSAEIDHVVEHVLKTRTSDSHVQDFSPYGYDERQFGSPGINLPVGRLTRSVHGGYAEYHSSADNLDNISEERLQESVEIVTEVLETLEHNRYFVNLSPNCEPQLGRRGLYRDTGGTQIEDRESAMLWLLNQSDGTNSMLDIAERSGIQVASLSATAQELVEAGLLEEWVAT